MSKIISLREAREILTSGAFDVFLGTLETEELEFKSSPYQVELDTARMELAKDVCALANGSGGIIVIGIQTAKNLTVQGDEARKIGCFTPDKFDIGRHKKIINDWIYPPIAGLSITFHPNSKNASEGVISISVPAEATMDRPYVVIRVVDLSGKIAGAQMAYFERVGPDVVPMSAQQLRDRLKDGWRFSELYERLDSVDQRLSELSSARATMPDAATPPTSILAIEERVADARSTLNLEDGPTLFHVALPQESTQFPSLFDSRSTTLVQLLENPPRLRPDGFDLRIGRPSVIVAGERRRSEARNRKLLEFWKDGTVMFVAAGDGSFLCWGMRSTAETGLLINNIVLAETTYLFVDTALKAYQHADPKPKKILFRMGLLSMTHSGKLTVLNDARPAMFNLGAGNSAPGDNRTVDVTVDLQHAEPGRVAYSLLGDLYAWFGFERTSMPFVAADGGRIDPSLI